MESYNPRLLKDCLTVREANESLVNKKSGHVSLTQLNPKFVISCEISSTGCLLSPSVTTTSRCDGQFTHASFTRWPVSSTIHRESVDSGSAAVETERKKKMKKFFMLIYFWWLSLFFVSVIFIPCIGYKFF